MLGACILTRELATKTRNTLVVLAGIGYAVLHCAVDSTTGTGRAVLDRKPFDTTGTATQ